MTHLAAPPHLRNFRPTTADSLDQTSSRSKRALRRFNYDLVNLASLLVNVHDFLHRGMSCPSRAAQIPREMPILTSGVDLKTMFVAGKHGPRERSSTDHRSP